VARMARRSGVCKLENGNYMKVLSCLEYFFVVKSELVRQLNLSNQTVGVSESWTTKLPSDFFNVVNLHNQQLTSTWVADERLQLSLSLSLAELQ